PERRHTEIVGGVHVGAGANQQTGALHVIPIAHPVQGRGAVCFRRVHVYFFLEQNAQRILVTVPGGVNERRSGGPHEEHCRRQGDQALPTGCHPHGLPYTPESPSSGSLPVLPPSRSNGTSNLSISATSRFAMVGLSEYVRSEEHTS